MRQLTCGRIARVHLLYGLVLLPGLGSLITAPLWIMRKSHYLGEISVDTQIMPDTTLLYTLCQAVVRELV